MLAAPRAGDGRRRDHQARGRQRELLLARRGRVVGIGPVGVGGPRSGHLQGPRDRRGRATRADQRQVERASHFQTRRRHRPGSDQVAAAGRDIGADPPLCRRWTFHPCPRPPRPPCRCRSFPPCPTSRPSRCCCMHLKSAGCNRHRQTCKERLHGESPCWWFPPPLPVRWERAGERADLATRNLARPAPTLALPRRRGRDRRLPARPFQGGHPETGSPWDMPRGPRCCHDIWRARRRRTIIARTNAPKPSAVAELPASSPLSPTRHAQPLWA